MKKQKNQSESIQLSEIVSTVKSTESITVARDKLKFAIGSIMQIKGIIQKVVKRDQQLKFVIIDESDARQMLVFADMRDDAERVKLGKYRKGKTAEIVGQLVSFGYMGVNLSNCKLTDGFRVISRQNQACCRAKKR